MQRARSHGEEAAKWVNPWVSDCSTEQRPWLGLCSLAAWERSELHTGARKAGAGVPQCMEEPGMDPRLRDGITPHV